MKIKQILAATALTVVAQSASAFLVIGDSVAAWQTSWPQVMREQYGSWIRADVQSMRALVSYDYPDDLLGIDGHQSLAVLALGFNDGSYVSIGVATPEDYRLALIETVSKLHAGAYGFKASHDCYSARHARIYRTQRRSSLSGAVDVCGMGLLQCAMDSLC